jgi:DnaJ-class molecular chaperone
MEYTDYYQILGVDKKASQEEIKGKGGRGRNNNDGDLLVQLQIDIPENITPIQKNLFEQLKKVLTNLELLLPVYIVTCTNIVAISLPFIS